MSKKAHPAVIGIFVVSAVAIAIGSVVVLGSGRLFAEVNRYVLFFEGSVKGLKVGSPVMFRGVEIGSVSDVSMKIDPKDLRVLIPVFIEVEVDRMDVIGGSPKDGDVRENVDRFVAKGLRAQLEMQNLLTGQLLIQFDFHPDTPVDRVGIDMGVPQLPTIPTPIQQVAKTLESMNLKAMVDEITQTMDTLGYMITAPELKETIRTLPLVLDETRTLVRDLREGVAPVMGDAERVLERTERLAGNLDRRTASLSEELHGAVRDGRGLLQNMDGRVETLSEETRKVLQGGAQLLEKAQTTLRTLDAALEKADAAVAKMDTELEAGPQLRYEVRTALEEISAAARAVRVLANLLQQRPDALLRGKPGGGR